MKRTPKPVSTAMENRALNQTTLAYTENSLWKSAAGDKRQADISVGVQGDEVGAFSRLDGAALVIEAQEAGGIGGSHSCEVDVRDAERAHHAHGVEHCDHGAG